MNQLTNFLANSRYKLEMLEAMFRCKQESEVQSKGKMILRIWFGFSKFDFLSDKA